MPVYTSLPSLSDTNRVVRERKKSKQMLEYANNRSESWAHKLKTKEKRFLENERRVLTGELENELFFQEWLDNIKPWPPKWPIEIFCLYVKKAQKIDVNFLTTFLKLVYYKLI